MKEARLVKEFNIDGKLMDLRFIEKASTEKWPGHSDSMPLKLAGYWYGNRTSHEYVGRVRLEAQRYLEMNHSVVLE